ncbi:hypothetical protein [Halobellus rarus]|uniref:Uncharacterized protein n=1 Tax=Halobellus rarus TaxID=1126237 RepID=A0ABD6CQC6_9EURY|nr:hypothetical protein [Halobellus rarus]
MELEGWVTSVALLAANYNNTRSNRSSIRASDGDTDADADGVGDDVRGEDYNVSRSNRSIARPGDIINGDIDEGDETFRVVSRLDSQLQEATKTAATAISKRSARTGPNPETEKEITAAVGDMMAVLAEMRAVLERCSDDSCVAALENVGHREADVQRASDHIKNGEWEAFGMTSGDDDDLLVGDYLLPSASFDPSGLFSAAEQAELFRYLEQNPVIAERFSVCLPDAEIPGGNGSIREAVTPERLFAYLAGQAGDGNVYSWGRSKVASDNSGDCDDADDTQLPGAVCGTSPHFVADVSEPVATGGGLVAERGSDGRVTVVNTPPSTERGAPVLVCPAEGEPFEPEGLDAWGQRADGPPLTMTHQGRLLNLTVAQVMVQPPGCPQPVPALMYVGRGLSDEQLVYSGGWLINDAALYSRSATVLTMEGSAQVVGIECCFDFSADADGDGFRDVVARAGLSERALRGAQIESGTVSALVKTGTLSEDGGGEVYCWGSNNYSKENSGSCGETGADGGELMVTHCPLDAPILHLVNGPSASSEVKFKTGAELSKSVN